MRLLELPEVMQAVKLRKTMIYRLMNEGSFPRPVKQGTSSRWVEAEIDAYIQRLMSARPVSQSTPPLS